MLNNLALTFEQMGQIDSARKYALESYNMTLKSKRWEFIAETCAILSRVYEGRDDKKIYTT